VGTCAPVTLARETGAFTEGIGGAVFGTGELQGDLAKVAGWVINLAVAEWGIGRKPGCRRKRAVRRGSDRDHDLSADLALLEQPHGVWCFVERVVAVHARDDLAGLNEAGEPLEVGGALLRHEQHETLPQEG
jgi:hypothetical protein